MQRAIEQSSLHTRPPLPPLPPPPPPPLLPEPFDGKARGSVGALGDGFWGGETSAANRTSASLPVCAKLSIIICVYRDGWEMRMMIEGGLAPCCLYVYMYVSRMTIGVMDSPATTND